MDAAHFTPVPQLRGRRERAPVVPSPVPRREAARTARHARTWAPWWRSSAGARTPVTRPGRFLGIWLRVPVAVLDSTRARYGRPPQSWRDAANLRSRPRPPRQTCWVRTANDFLGRYESANLSRLLTRRTLASGSPCGAISSSSRTSREASVNSGPRSDPRGRCLFSTDFPRVCASASVACAGMAITLRAPRA